MKIIWIGGLLALLVVVAYDRLFVDTGGAVVLAATTGAGVANLPKPVRPVAVAAPAIATAADSDAISIAEYVLLHKTRDEGAPTPGVGVHRPSPK